MTLPLTRTPFALVGGLPIPGGTVLKCAAITVPDDAWTAITLGTSEEVKNVLIQCRTAADMLISSEADGDPYFTLKSGGQLSIDVAKIGTVVYAKSGSGDLVAEVLATK